MTNGNKRVACHIQCKAILRNPQRFWNRWRRHPPPFQKNAITKTQIPLPTEPEDQSPNAGAEHCKIGAWIIRRGCGGPLYYSHYNKEPQNSIGNYEGPVLGPEGPQGPGGPQSKPRVGKPSKTKARKNPKPKIPVSKKLGDLTTTHKNYYRP